MIENGTFLTHSVLKLTYPLSFRYKKVIKNQQNKFWHGLCSLLM